MTEYANRDVLVSTNWVAENAAKPNVRGAYLPLESVPQIEARELDHLLGEKPGKVRLIDVRRPAEWQEGHIEGAELKPLHQLQRLHDDFDAQVPLAVCCQRGYRSSIACSILRRAGFAHVMNLVGGTAQVPSLTA